MIPGWPYSVIGALEPGRTSQTAVLDTVRRLKRIQQRTGGPLRSPIRLAVRSRPAHFPAFPRPPGRATGDSGAGVVPRLGGRVHVTGVMLPVDGGYLAMNTGASIDW
jgi:hypothetical protein